MRYDLNTNDETLSLFKTWDPTLKHLLPTGRRPGHMRELPTQIPF